MIFKNPIGMIGSLAKSRLDGGVYVVKRETVNVNRLQTVMQGWIGRKRWNE